MADEVRKVLKELKDKMIEEEQAKIDLEKKKNKNKKGWVEPILDTEKLNPRIPESLLSRIFQWRLTQNDCKYRGFVLDSFPRNYENSVALFTKDSEKFFLEEKEREANKKPKEKGAKSTFIEDNNLDLKKKFDLFIDLIPQTVVFLHAGDDFLKERCKSLGNVVGTHYTEEGILRRLLSYKKMNEENVGRNVYSFYRDNEFEVLDVNVEEKKNYEEFFKEIMKFIERVFFYILLLNKQFCIYRKDLLRPIIRRIKSWRWKSFVN